jgi:glutamyl-tRNA(Gln) amidotransferase subunit E
VIACLDVMPNIVSNARFQEFGLSEKEIASLETLFEVKQTDRLILVWGSEPDVKTAVNEIKIRAIEATVGVPSETRQVFPDGTNDFERILPGPNRMYPDTDTPPTPITEKTLENIRKEMPEPLWESEKRLGVLGLPQSLVASLSVSRRLKLFHRIIDTLKINPILVAVTLEETLKSLKRTGHPVEMLSDETVYQVFTLFHDKNCSKEAIPSLLAFLADHPQKTVHDALAELQISPITIETLDRFIEEIVVRFSNPQKSGYSFNAIMGEVMKVARHKIDGKIVSDVLKTKLKMSTDR